MNLTIHKSEKCLKAITCSCFQQSGGSSRQVRKCMNKLTIRTTILVGLTTTATIATTTIRTTTVTTTP